MKDLKVATAVAGDATEIRSRVVAGFERPHVITLRVDLKDFALPGDVVLEKEVYVHARLVRDELNLNDELHIEFEGASSPGLFPKFRGILDVFPGEKSGESILELRGNYEPPFGFGGAAFDSAIGYLVAQRSVKTFLDEVAASIQRGGLESQHVNP